MVEKSTRFPPTFFDVISLVKKSKWFSRTLFDLISMVEKSTLFSLTLFDVILIVEKSTLFPRTFISVISMVAICTLFLPTFFDVILMSKDLTSFLVSRKLMKTFDKVFPVFVTLNSELLQDCSLSIFQVNLPGVAQFHCKLSLTTSTTAKELLQVGFLGIYRAATLPNNFLTATLL